MLRLPRVEGLLGSSLQEADEAAILRLVDGGIEEDIDLDFKSSPYTRDDKGKHELAKDVAAMANMRGGLVLLGIRDEDGIAVEHTPFAIDEAETLRMQQVIASSIAPVPMVEVRRVPSDTKPASSYCLLAIARTAAAPHAVVKDKSLRYPLRSGSETRWLHESEVADAYRNRFAGATAQAERLTQIHIEAQRRLEATEGWLIVSLVPSLRGHTQMGLAGLNRVHAWWREREERRLRFTRFEVPRWHTITVGFRRFLASDTHLSSAQRARYLHAELHSDGSAVAATAVWPSAEKIMGFSDQALTFAVIACLDELAAFASDIAGVSGDVVVRVELTAPEHHDPPRLVSTSTTGDFAQVGQADEFIADYTLAIDDLTGPLKARLMAARLVLDDAVSAFGEPENSFITSAGELLIDRFNPTYAGELRRWLRVQSA